MLELEEKILAEGEILPGNTLRVGSFLNQQIDVQFMDKIGQEIARLYDGCGVTKILTIEASGIPVAYAAAQKIGVPMVFAKKHKSISLTDNLYKSSVFSYTHQKTYDIVVSKEHISENDVILIVDDFLAHGKALIGLIDLVHQSGASIAGAAIAIEKGFQDGGKQLRAKGIRVESLAIVESMTDDSITFAH